MFRKPEISGTIFWNVPEISRTFQNSVTIRNSGTTFRKFPFYRKKIVPEFWFSVTFSIMEMEKISGSFPYVNRNPEFRWKPYFRQGVFYSVIYDSAAANVKSLWITFIKELRLSTHMYVCFIANNLFRYLQKC